MGFFDKMFGKKEEETKVVTPTIKLEANQIGSVGEGTISPITDCEDPVFGQKMMGDGYLLHPTSNIIVSPVNGVVQTVFPTKHAIGIVSDNGDEIIIHVGLDTVKLNGKGFTSFIEANDKVVVGQKLLEVDFAAIKSEVPTIDTPVVITNIGEREVVLAENTTVSAGDLAITIK